MSIWQKHAIVEKNSIILVFGILIVGGAVYSIARLLRRGAPAEAASEGAAS